MAALSDVDMQRVIANILAYQDGQEHEFDPNDPDDVVQSMIYPDGIHNPPLLIAWMHWKIKQLLQEHHQLRIHCYANYEYTELNLGEIEAPCILLFGPDLVENNDDGLPIRLMIDTGVDEAGYVKTRTFIGIRYFIAEYEVMFLSRNDIEMAVHMNGQERFLSTYKALHYDGFEGDNSYACSMDIRKSLTMRTYAFGQVTNTLVHRGRFLVRNIRDINSRLYVDSKRVYNVNSNTHKKET